MAQESESLSRAIQESCQIPVLYVVLAPLDCGDCRRFIPVLNKIEAAFGDKLKVVRAEGTNKRANNPPDIKQDLAYFAYPDGSEHFPSGGIFVNGREIYRLPSDRVLARISSQQLAEEVSRKTQLEYDNSIVLPNQKSGWRFWTRGS